MKRILVLAILFNSQASGSDGSDDVCAPLVFKESWSRDEHFEQARAAYIRGCHTLALDTFEAFTGDAPEPIDALHLKALVFLGEVAYKLGDRERSLEAFQTVLTHQPEYQISLIDHDPDAVSLFQLARVLEKQKPAPIAPAPPTPALAPTIPAWTFAPFGVPQFKNGRPVAGAAHAVLQAAGASLSVGMFVHISKNWDRPYKPKEVQRANLLRFGVQWPATALFWGSYLVSHLQARKAWKETQRLGPIAFDVRIQPNGAWVAIHVPVL